MSSEKIIEVDGSYGEAGGALLRVAVALSVLTQKPIRIFNIRAGRKQPGLKTQHLEGLRATAVLCGAKLKGATLGSTEIEFAPAEIKESRLTISIPTAGSIGLILQILQLAAINAPAPVDIFIKGGADFGKFAPPIPYLQQVTLALLEKMGYKIEIKTLKHGFYPVGGGQTEIKIWPARELRPLNLTEQGAITKIDGASIAAHQLEKRDVAGRQAKAAAEIVQKEIGIAPEIRVEHVEAACPGSGIVLWMKTNSGAILGSGAIGELRVTAEQIGHIAARDLAADFKTGAAVDRYATDQLIPFMALAAEFGPSAIKVPAITSHAATNIWVVEKFLPVEFRVDEKKKVISVGPRGA